MYVIVGSLICALLHAIIEFVFVSLEAKACKTTLMHYCIVCFNARFGWIPFQNLFTSVGATYEDDDTINYEEIRSKLFGQAFDVDFAFSKSTAQSLVNCISKLPIEDDYRKRKNVIIGKSMDEVEMDKLIDLVEMAYKRVNINIDNLNVDKLLERSDSEHIRKNIENPPYLDKENRHESILLNMIRIERTHMVKEMCKRKEGLDGKGNKIKKTMTDL